jgi:DNA transformation protein and related proteins
MPKPLSPLVEHSLELFSPLGQVRAKAMFGGWGFYLDDLFFALVADDTLYLKADAESEAAFREAGSWPFTYSHKDGRSVTMGYWSAPEEAMESPAMMHDWGRMALAAALRARRAKPGRAARQSATPPPGR